LRLSTQDTLHHKDDNKLKAFITTMAISTLWAVNIIPTLAATRSSFYFPNQDFCATYKGSVESEKRFALLIQQENQLTVQANKNLTIAVTHQGKVVTPYQIDSLSDRIRSLISYRTTMLGEHIISVKGTTSDAKITLCLR
jgi:hypothetical protein